MTKDELLLLESLLTNFLGYEVTAEVMLADEINQAIAIVKREASDAKDAQIEEAHQLCERLAELLTGVAAGLKGEPPPDTLHDWSGLPRLAAQVVQERDELYKKYMAVIREVETPLGPEE